MKKKKIALKDLQSKKKKEETHHHSDSKLKTYLPAIISFVMLVIGILLDQVVEYEFFAGWRKLAWYLIAYIPVGAPVIWQGLKSISKGDFYTEFFLMGIATLGAFYVGEFAEGVAVMLFYTVGELFQHSAVHNAKNNIRALLDVRPNTANVRRDDKYISVHPEEVEVGEKIQVKVGGKIPLDGILLSESARLNTAALTGESLPQSIKKGDQVLSGSINLNGVIEVETTKIFKDSSVARIIELVQNASSRKSKTELFIRKFARIYTPIIVYSALALTFLPYFFVETYVFQDWLYRALIFLVISCPCALVISIPLGYFGGLGAASKNGILFKGASFLDEITKINTLVLDKTGTITKGVFKVQKIVTQEIPEKDFLNYLISLDNKSTHPIAKAIVEYGNLETRYEVEEIHEISGKGLSGKVNNKQVLAGNAKLLKQFNISFPEDIHNVTSSIVVVAIDGLYAGYVTISDELKDGVKETLSKLKKNGLKEIIMLSGDKDSITKEVAKGLNIDWAKGGLLPEDKLKEMEILKKDSSRKVAFVGDGINDAPVLALSDVGIAMGGLGSDVAIETADVVIQTDQPSKIWMGMRIGRSTRKIVWQNIVLAFGVKAIVLILGAFGIATMWEAVFADVGVAFLAILNAIRLQRMEWK
ncbi:cadmium-translocating P-type ATPase [Gillisia sp. M10.2A]|uniref:P-type Zn(2+) transporter n=1 Tax=Gillisia lutea TaxID=2909668 RepID=A0ABS9EJ27_9FLAO|nr:heavy metal translocating P-type ATPase [Gillisia lutea]MCF4101864.1 cadmium-translocating P-type ATPase [Gillisia lutea]